MQYMVERTAWGFDCSIPVCGGNNEIVKLKNKVRLLLFDHASRSYWFSYHRQTWMSNIWSFLQRKPTVATSATLSDKQQGTFHVYFPTDMAAHTTAFDRPVVDHWLERKVAQTANVSTVQDRLDDQTLHRLALYRLSYLQLHYINQ